MLQEKAIHFMGMGRQRRRRRRAKKAQALCPAEIYRRGSVLEPMLEAVSAKVDGESCVAHMGKDAAGHYVKMVHNGIEYAIMQLISEVYDVMKRGLGFNNDKLAAVFKKWNEQELQSFLVEITAEIFLKDDEDAKERLVDVISDKAGSKGTGKWTSQDAMELPVSIPTIDVAVAMRTLSGYKDERIAASQLYDHEVKKIKGKKDADVKQIKDALFFSVIICYAQGLAMLHKASAELSMDIPLQDVVKIWRGGCIIRSSLLEDFYKAFKKDELLSNILLNKNVAKLLKRREKNARAVVRLAVQSRIPVTGLMSALGYFDAYCTTRMPTNLIQAQRDYFGAHTYERIDKEGRFHTEWVKEVVKAKKHGVETENPKAPGPFGRQRLADGDA
jgi:6-phosphogluconate dehydrogenase